MDVVITLIAAAVAGLAGSFIGAFAQRSVAQWQIEADNAKIRSASYREFLRLATPQRIQRSMSAAAFNAAGREVEDQAAVERWRGELDAASGDLLVVAPESVHSVLMAFLEAQANELLRIQTLVGSCVNEGMGDWISLQEGLEAVKEQRWKDGYEALVMAIRSDVAAV